MTSPTCSSLVCIHEISFRGYSLFLVYIYHWLQGHFEVRVVELNISPNPALFGTHVHNRRSWELFTDVEQGTSLSKEGGIWEALGGRIHRWSASGLGRQQGLLGRGKAAAPPAARGTAQFAAALRSTNGSNFSFCANGMCINFGQETRKHRDGAHFSRLFPTSNIFLGNSKFFRS